MRNIAAYTGYDPNRRNYWLWAGGGTAGSNVLANGVFVSLNPVPGTDAGWTNAPFEAQYLKLYDVTPPAAPAAPATPKPYALGTSATFTWPALVDPDGGISAYHLIVGTSPAGSDAFNATVSGTSVTVTNGIGTTLYARVSAINNAGIEGPFSPTSAGTILLDPNGDYDHDGMTSAAEDIAGTDPLDTSSVLRILSLANGNLLTWSSVSNRTYLVLATAGLATNFVPISGVVTATGPTASYLDSTPTDSCKFYRINVLP